MQGPRIPWRPGRIDGFAKDATPDGRLPDATQGSDHLRNVSRVHSVPSQTENSLLITHTIDRWHRIFFIPVPLAMPVLVSIGPIFILRFSTAWGGYRRLIFSGSGLLIACVGGNRFNDQEIVALSGAHALGRCHIDRFVPRTNALSTHFSNIHFLSLTYSAPALKGLGLSHLQHSPMITTRCCSTRST